MRKTCMPSISPYMCELIHALMPYMVAAVLEAHPIAALLSSVGRCVNAAWSAVICVGKTNQLMYALMEHRMHFVDTTRTMAW